MADWIDENILVLDELNKDLDREIADFKHSTGMDCLPGCGDCCLYPEIEATVLEFLPLGYYLYKEGRAAEFLSRDLSRETPCILFRQNRDSGQWGCSLYPYRGLICRLFGFSATLSKEGAPLLATCKKIKKKWPGYQGAMEGAGGVPIMRDYYNRLRDINPGLAGTLYPINEAIRRAIEQVGFTLKYSSASVEQGPDSDRG